MDPSEKYKRKRRDKTTKNKTMVDMGASEKDKEFWTEKVLRAFGGRLRSLFSPSFAHFWYRFSLSFCSGRRSARQKRQTKTSFRAKKHRF